MGSVFSPSYANIFMGSFETKYIYPRIRGKCKFYSRYIDDIFMIWNGTSRLSTQFTTRLSLKQTIPSTVLTF